MEITLILDNIRSTYNVGAILRTCEGFGVTEVIFSGYTPFPGEKPGVLPHIAEKLEKQIGKTALGAEKMVKCTFCSDIKEFLAEKSASGGTIIALENNILDSRLIRLSEVKQALNGIKRAYLIAGEEVSGIDSKLYPYISIFAEIPMQGQKESFNVSVATGIALYELAKGAE
ncbi:TrmH family RNA methyltransferase [Candidatus Saccharibacteria bacterium]|nr:TrmH family RNA methyltransferase [Candidatus Saccharibacteria bacterium]